MTTSKRSLFGRAGTSAKCSTHRGDGKVAESSAAWGEGGAAALPLLSPSQRDSLPLSKASPNHGHYSCPVLKSFMQPGK